MPDYRRYYQPGGSYFFTLATAGRRPFLVDSIARTCLREAIETIRERFHFEMPAVVLLPDHLHAIWNLPSGDSDYSVRWRRIKEEFTRSYLNRGGQEAPRSQSRRNRDERGIWQRRFWEHLLVDEEDFIAHMDYIHYNPVKHGVADSPWAWPYSSFRRWVQRGVYSREWGAVRQTVPAHADSLPTTGE